MVPKLLILVVGAAGVATAATFAFGPAELGRGSTHSDNLTQVKADPTWLDYLPGPSDTRFQLSSLTSTTVSGDVTRRVDLFDDQHHASVSLCFADSRAHLQAACPGASVLGQISRDVDQPWVALVGNGRLDYLALLSEPAPTLAQATYVSS
ncbi:MAG: hypothetical protein JWP74_1125 [Marmoricola sp.]|nr:hypothetical protein [Marmoricola sp.]